jgi:peptidoglycan/xylan/chitin deacetylase (PgdA/CDA1 family)
MAKSREHIVNNGKAAFYAAIWPDLLHAALDCGWALGLHGSLSNDMDIMAMPWIEEAKPVEELMQALSDCFTGNIFKDGHCVPSYGKPNGRVVYTMSIWADFYLDINIIERNNV